uniref:Uncharacterized protein n=1 Tax=Bactrocera latifrons TaxID=174628 RepID=A0A0K8V1T4_BACLA
MFSLIFWIMFWYSSWDDKRLSDFVSIKVKCLDPNNRRVKIMDTTELNKLVKEQTKNNEQRKLNKRKDNDGDDSDDDGALDNDGNDEDDDELDTEDEDELEYGEAAASKTQKATKKPLQKRAPTKSGVKNLKRSDSTDENDNEEDDEIDEDDIDDDEDDGDEDDDE